MWNILFKKDIEIQLPVNFNVGTMYPFIDKVIDEKCDAKCSELTFDFSAIRFIKPVGVVVLSNLIEYLRKAKVKVRFKGHKANTDANIFLDDAGFFKHYLKEYVFESHSARTTTIPLELVANKEATAFLYTKLMPWIGREVGLSEDSLSAIRTSIEEIFHNIRDHSGVGIGCVFAQHFPRNNTIELAISDFGLGIPVLVRTKLPDISDTDALKKAAEQGFTTQSNVRNRGAGLTNITRYITQRNNGTILISSGKAQISAVRDNGVEPKMTARSTFGFYPGTLVRAILRTDTFEQVVEDAEVEIFEW
ncbi:MAG: histidine kinase [Methylotenera sp.]|nr:histidine kinase [Methylotenera sp.]